MLRNNWTDRLKMSTPIIQAPMAGGITTTKLVTEVSLHGGLGMIGAGYMTTLQLEEQIKEVKQHMTHRFGVNLFVPSSFQADEKKIRDTQLLLQKYEGSLGMESQKLRLPTFEETSKEFENQVETILSNRVPICSFTFGLPSRELIQEFKKEGILLIGTATTVDEAMANEEVGMDAVVVQGYEAGGHRGNFLSTHEEGSIGLMSFIPQAVEKVRIPVIAAGGIMDGRGVVAALSLGAQAVQMGTAFLVCKESGAASIHKQAILQARPEEIQLTRAFSGKWARGIENKFMQEMNERESVIPDFPIQHTLTQPIRKAATEQNQSDYMSLWAGQSPMLSKDQTVKMLMDRLWKEVELVKKSILV